MDKNPKKTLRKIKYAPKIPRTKSRPQSTKIEEERVEEDEYKSDEIQATIRRLKENTARRQSKVEKQSRVQDAFPGSSSLSPRTLRSGSKRSGLELNFSANEKNGSTYSSTSIEDFYTSVMHATDDSTDEEDYKELWNCPDSIYPVTLPLRKPNSGNPAILDEEEFGVAATNVEYDDKPLNSAEELGLLDHSEQPKMIIFQLPTVLPGIKQPVSRKGKEKMGASNSAKPKKGSNLLQIRSGCIGKMQVYKSGAVKLKIGETQYDVSAGTKTIFYQDVVAINPGKKDYSVLGAVTANTKAVVTPDLDSVDLLKD
ncbi:unnamed protein product [Lathyrus sativus]|nr:unnamed protein product [Lathyrus sativus]